MQDMRTLGAMAGAALVGQAIRSGWRPHRRPRDARSGLVSLAPGDPRAAHGDLAAYHGVEHKSIAAYETDGEAAEARQGARPLRIEPRGADARRGGRRQRGCAPGRPARARWPRRRVALGSAAVAVEVFAWSERHEGTRLSKLLRRPGYEIQRVVGTREPTERAARGGRAAMAEILRVEAARPSRAAVIAQRSNRPTMR